MLILYALWYCSIIIYILDICEKKTIPFNDSVLFAFFWPITVIVYGLNMLFCKENNK